MIHRTIDLIRLINNKIGIRSLKFSHMLDIKMKVIYYLNRQVNSKKKKNMQTAKSTSMMHYYVRHEGMT